ncbi:hypothetical protein BU23DRAFT_72114 [Bimuria novae-zelandiae CBS 107.79]|uniref:Uncharacterized protein n=1 Tax=Bimuria novae-zelandiae CBS 107.79 TaxID=1447943 RepID=A0A6A5UG67_9PLEO|nr:hypothetical protein BU23DRAFT_72114 [Bimuria novae-zelandiae CBS 107.79]
MERLCCLAPAICVPQIHTRPRTAGPISFPSNHFPLNLSHAYNHSILSISRLSQQPSNTESSCALAPDFECLLISTADWIGAGIAITATRMAFPIVAPPRTRERASTEPSPPVTTTIRPSDAGGASHLPRQLDHKRARDSFSAGT